MLKVKKIMESVIPNTKAVSEEDRRIYEKNANDGMMYFDGSGSLEVIYCLRCGTQSNPASSGTLKCSRCGNTNIRQRNYCRPRYLIRNVELIDGFLVIKDSVISASEKMDGVEVTDYDENCIVIQGYEIGAFENRIICGCGIEAERKWTRVKKLRNTYYHNGEKLHCRIGSEDVYDHPMFALIQEDVYKAGMGDLYSRIKNQEVVVEEEKTQCPSFDEGLISYDTTKANVTHQLKTRKEYIDNSSNLFRLHAWCTRCGKYGQKMENSRFSHTEHNCPNPNCRSNGRRYPAWDTNYYITPQEFADGTMLMRIDEAVYKAELKGELLMGVDPEVTYKLEITKTIYVYVMLTGKAAIYNADGEMLDKTGIPAGPTRCFAQNFIYSDAQKGYILNNKAVKRTGFVEYARATTNLDIRYFDALQRIPSLEMISKMGLHALVRDLIFADDKDIPGYLKKEDTGTGIKRLTKPQMQSLIQGGCTLSQFVAYMQVAKKDTEALFDDFQWISGRSHSRHLLDILRVKIPNMTVKKIREYLDHVEEAQCCPVNESAQLWSDYVRMLRDLNCDLTDKRLVFPNSLKREHDKAAKKITQVRDEKLNAAFRERAVENEKYAWENGDFKVLIPHDISELYEEGRKLSHCVGTYGKVVAEGQSVVAFIRRVSDVDSPLCTIEIRKNVIVQASGMSNRPAENIPKMKTFIKAWASNKGLQYAA